MERVWGTGFRERIWGNRVSRLREVLDMFTLTPVH